MPNHVHVIFDFFDWPEGVRPGEEDVPPDGLQNALAGSLGVVVSRYKSSVTRPINQLGRTLGTAVWQRGYYERIIRNERELHAIREYICNNPVRWNEGRDNLDKLLQKMTYHS